MKSIKCFLIKPFCLWALLNSKMWFLKVNEQHSYHLENLVKKLLRPHPQIQLSQKLLSGTTRDLCFYKPSRQFWCMDKCCEKQGLSHSASVQFHNLSLPRYFSFCALVSLWLPTILFGIIINYFIPESLITNPSSPSQKGIKRWFKVCPHSNYYMRLTENLGNSICLI